MDYLLASTEVATLFLDRDLCIRRSTPKLAGLFNLLQQDISRPIDAFTSTLERPGLLEELSRVLAERIVRHATVPVIVARPERR